MPGKSDFSSSSPALALRFQRNKSFFPAHSQRFRIVRSLREREVAWSVSDRQGLNFEYCVWRVVYHLIHPQSSTASLRQYSLYVLKGGLNPTNTKHLHKIHATSAQRLRRWSNIVQMLYKCPVFTGRLLHSFIPVQFYNKWNCPVFISSQIQT